MIIYIDSDFKCHISPGEGLTAVETEFFDGKCPELIESFRFVPAGETWVRKDGVMFHGEMISPWKDVREAHTAQMNYLSDRNTQYEAALSEIEAALEVTT